MEYVSRSGTRSCSYAAAHALSTALMLGRRADVVKCGNGKRGYPHRRFADAHRIRSVPGRCVGFQTAWGRRPTARWRAWARNSPRHHSATAQCRQLRHGGHQAGRRPPHGTLRDIVALRNTSPDARRELCELLVDCFTADEFREFFADLGPEFVPNLPEPGCTRTKLVADGVDLLLRLGRVDPYFFKKWAELRPARQSQILAVAKAVGCQTPQVAVGGPTGLSAAIGAVPVCVATQQPAPDFNLWILLLFVLLVIVAVVLLVELRDSSFRVEYMIATILILVAIMLALLRAYAAAAAALIAGLVLLFWVGWRMDRRKALAS